MRSIAARDIEGQSVTVLSGGVLFHGVVSHALDDPDGGARTIAQVQLQTHNGVVSLGISEARGDWLDVGTASRHLRKPRPFVRSLCGVVGTLIRIDVQVTDSGEFQRSALIARDAGGIECVKLDACQQLSRVAVPSMAVPSTAPRRHQIRASEWVALSPGFVAAAFR